MRRAAFLSAALAAITLLTACPDRRRTEETADRIVTLSPALTETAFKLGCGQRLVGRTDACDYPAEARSLPEAGRFGDPDAERTLKLKPDLILANTLVNPRLRNTFQNAGIRVIVRPCESVEDYLAWLDIFERELHAPGAKSEREQTLGMLEDFRKAASSGRNVLFLLWDDPLLAAGSGTLPDTAIRLAGGKNAGAGDKGYYKCSREYLLSGGIDVIVWAMVKPVPAFYTQRWSVYAGFDLNALLRPGPRFLRIGVPGLRDFLLKQGRTGTAPEGTAQ